MPEEKGDLETLMENTEEKLGKKEKEKEASYMHGFRQKKAIVPLNPPGCKRHYWGSEGEGPGTLCQNPPATR